MKPYLFSLGAGLLVGIVYGLLNVRSPAPPVIALLGLLGILVGEQIVAAARRTWDSKPVTLTWVRSECAPRILGIGSAADQLPLASNARQEGEPRAPA